MTMKSYRLFVLETPADDEAIRFDCQADNAEHAIEQAVNAYPQGEVVSLSVVDQRVGITGALLRMNESGAYEMPHAGGPLSVWLSVGNAAVCISQGNDSMRVAVHARGLFKAEQAVSVSDVPYRILRPSDERVFYRLTGADQAVHRHFAPTADDLWAELGDIPVSAKDEIEVNWRQFVAGTHREDIWRWFEAKHPGFSVAKAQGHP
jgi:hypothetical protein